MKIFVIGSGAREHAIIWKLKTSPIVEKIYYTGNNHLISKIAENIDIDLNKMDKLADFAEEKSIDLTIVCPEKPLCEGIVDIFESRGLKIFGANKSSARLEGSKAFAKKFMNKYGIRTARYKEFLDYESALKELEDTNYPIVIKADGLCAGKGVFISNNKKEAKANIEDIFINKIFGAGGEKIIIEEFINGPELSQICLVSSNRIIKLETAMDYKKIGEGDIGPNTGGVGSISPNPYINEDINREIDIIIEKISNGIKEESLEFNGILFIGFIIKDNKPYVLEFNLRFGDPETQVLMLRLKSDLMEMILSTMDGSIELEGIFWDDRYAMNIVICSQGYPGSYEKRQKIQGIDFLNDVEVFSSATLYENGEIITNGGRVLSICGLDNNLESCRKRLYKEIEKVYFKDSYFRRDIGDIKLI